MTTKELKEQSLQNIREALESSNVEDSVIRLVILQTEMYGLHCKTEVYDKIDERLNR